MSTAAFWHPSRFPLAFHAIVRAGEGSIHTTNLPWSAETIRRRFYDFVKTLRRDAAHPLHPLAAGRRWAVALSREGWIIVKSTPCSTKKNAVTIG